MSHSLLDDVEGSAPETNPLALIGRGWRVLPKQAGNISQPAVGAAQLLRSRTRCARKTCAGLFQISSNLA